MLAGELNEPNYSMTSSAFARIECGTVMPSVFAVFRFTISSSGSGPDIDRRSRRPAHLRPVRLRRRAWRGPFGSPSSSSPARTDLAFCRCSGPLPQIASGDLDIAVVGQLPTPDLALHNEFEPSSMEVIGFDAPFRR